MSLESAKEFLEKIKIDSDLRQKVQKIQNKEARFGYIRSLGYDFTPDELKSLCDDMPDELSDEDLEAVAGGMISWY